MVLWRIHDGGREGGEKVVTRKVRGRIAWMGGRLYMESWLQELILQAVLESVFVYVCTADVRREEEKEACSESVRRSSS